MEIKEEHSSFSEESRSFSSSEARPSQSRKRHYSCDSPSDWPHGSPSDHEHKTHKKHKSDNALTSEGSTASMLNQFIGIIREMNDTPLHPFQNLLPEFDPSKHQTISAWLDKVDQFADMYCWNEAEQIQFALEKLAGPAKTWYQSQATVLYKWSEWRTKLYEAFRENYAELLSFMLSVRVQRGESLVNYYYEKMRLLTSCRIEGLDAVDCLLDGIDDDTVRLGAYAAHLETADQVIRYFQAVEETHRFNVNRQKIKKPMCFNCGVEGHKTFTCFRPKNKCSVCYKRGHLEIYCWARTYI